MKKHSFIIFICLLCCGCQPSYSKRIEKQLNISIPHYDKMTYRDNRGWFNDGEIYCEMSFLNNDIEEEIKQTNHWHDFPLNQDLQTFLKDYTNHFEFLQIKQGYWYFYDRHDLAIEHYNIKNLFTRSSYNVTIALYDTLEHKLYYLVVNT